MKGKQCGADFIGKPFSKDEEEQGLPESIVEFCSFDKLSNLEVIKKGKNRPTANWQMDNSAYFRKGKPGDWKNHLTANMIDTMDRITQEKVKGISLKFGVSTSSSSTTTNS